ncbi:MAG: right-handed parallel beta-helix repeat-containing protein [Candidatus Eisenbacteria bacterium]
MSIPSRATPTSSEAHLTMNLRPLTQRRSPISGTCASALALAAALVSLSGCGSEDKPNIPPVDPEIDVPGEVATIEEAIAIAHSGDTIRIAPGLYEIAESLDLSASSGVTMVGRSENDGERPLLRFTMTVNAGISVPGETRDVVLRGLALTGNFTHGIKASGTNTVVEDCRIDGGAYGISIESNADGIQIRNNLLAHTNRFGIRCVGQSHPDLLGNSVVGSQDCGIYTSDANPRCERNLVYAATNYGVACFWQHHAGPGAAIVFMPMVQLLIPDVRPAGVGHPRGSALLRS